MAENPRAMPDPATELSPPWPMAIAVVLLVILVAVFFTRAYGRGVRKRVRQQARDIARDFSAYLDDRRPSHELREAVEDAEPGAFWGALEPLAFRLPRADWLRLSHVLDRSRHEHSPAFPFHVYKLFVRCEIVGGRPAASADTTAVDFFAEAALPPLSISRVTEGQIRRMFEHLRHPDWPTDFE